MERGCDWQHQQVEEDAEDGEEVEGAHERRLQQLSGPHDRDHGSICESCGQQDLLKGQGHHRILHLDPFETAAWPTALQDRSKLADIGLPKGHSAARIWTQLATATEGVGGRGERELWMSNV